VKTLEYDVSVHRGYTSGFERLKDEFCRESRLLGSPKQREEVSLLDGQQPLPFEEVIGKFSRVVTAKRFEANHIKRLQRIGRVRGKHGQQYFVSLQYSIKSIKRWLPWPSSMRRRHARPRRAFCFVSRLKTCSS
jgi:hypothetical protein